MEIENKITIEKGDFINLIITALEGGSNDWYQLVSEQFENQLPPKTDTLYCLSERIGSALHDDPNFKMNVYDIEEVEEDDETGEMVLPEPLGVCTQESCMKAIGLLFTNYPMSATNILTENYDAADADVFFQLAVMGKLVYS